VHNHIIDGHIALTHAEESQGLQKLVSTAQAYKDSTDGSTQGDTPRVTNGDLGSRPTDASSVGSSASDDIKCGDAVWCHVAPPSSSYYGFEGPIDPRRWKEAQYLASIGKQVFMERIVKVHRSPYYYIDGDRIFRNLQPLVDVFTDIKTGLEPLLPNKDHLFSPVRRRLASDNAEGEEEAPAKQQLQQQQHRQLAADGLKVTELETTKALSVAGRQIVPNPYNFRVSERAPVVEMGYTAFAKDMNTFFSGNFLGGNFVKREWWFGEWAKIKDKIDTPFITMCSLNENWGPISTNFPNRTAGWGACCNKKNQRVIHEFLNHEKTLMLIINQHSNLSHPKILTLPRGLPLTWEHTSKVVWDSQRYNLNHVKKEKLLFAAASSWGKRPQILRCISDKMSIADFEGHSDTPAGELARMKTDRRHYYRKLGRAMFGVALPGLGYDCFRTWELLTMGTIVVIERGVGLDRTLWRLPALLVDDFYDVNPEMLRQAYVEAVYHRDDFEYERLTQSFWYEVIYNVSAAKSTAPMLDRFPMRAEKKNFARPKEPYECGKTDTCGPGTKRIPKNYC
jgi:hypothetical protein